ncbi:uncharacterized protein I303_107312 [Kwoniella dejecticola CBS 10117]|uniref:Uncharacterized protein n=1 Tax=Kwoniella dejecticola CBS 10117 TaxID=1296121 RepID=A0A1A5ZZC1_9TREE|nr:uncharacterized protein I303_06716 [Kwoniella dejecticola CBS 10117]OBR83157.1 hypothetical protein I303_06716 [Kwoniella dejecticola CBS 10117]
MSSHTGSSQRRRSVEDAYIRLGFSGVTIDPADQSASFTLNSIEEASSLSSDNPNEVATSLQAQLEVGRRYNLIPSTRREPLTGGLIEEYTIHPPIGGSYREIRLDRHSGRAIIAKSEPPQAENEHKEDDAEECAFEISAVLSGLPPHHIYETGKVSCHLGYTRIGGEDEDSSWRFKLNILSKSYQSTSKYRMPDADEHDTACYGSIKDALDGKEVYIGPKSEEAYARGHNGYPLTIISHPDLEADINTDEEKGLKSVRHECEHDADPEDYVFYIDAGAKWYMTTASRDGQDVFRGQAQGRNSGTSYLNTAYADLSFVRDPEKATQFQQTTSPSETSIGDTHRQSPLSTTGSSFRTQKARALENRFRALRSRR